MQTHLTQKPAQKYQTRSTETTGKGDPLLTLGHLLERQGTLVLSPGLRYQWQAIFAVSFCHADPPSRLLVSGGCTLLRAPHDPVLLCGLTAKGAITPPTRGTWQPGGWEDNLQSKHCKESKHRRSRAAHTGESPEQRWSMEA